MGGILGFACTDVAEATSCIARVIWAVFFTDLMRRRMSRRLAIFYFVKRLDVIGY
jgi:hypothetical protein